MVWFSPDCAVSAPGLGPLAALGEHVEPLDNQFAALPESFGQLAALVGQLAALAESFSGLAAVEDLYLYENSPAALPGSSI